MQSTKIQWCDSAVNPTAGCDGCELWCPQQKSCYAGVLHRRFAGTNPGFAQEFDKPELKPGRMAEAARWVDLKGKGRPQKPWLAGNPRMIFISDMSDALSSAIPFTYLRDEIVGVVTSEDGRRHVWLWPTKRPQRMAEFSAWLFGQGIGWPRNLWPGTSVTSRKTLTRIPLLLKVGDRETCHFVSAEPQLEAISLRPWLRRLKWIIQGGESGTGARPFHVEWAIAMKAACEQFDVPYFLKQLGQNPVWGGEKLILDDPHGSAMIEWPEPLVLARRVPSWRRRLRRPASSVQKPMKVCLAVSCAAD